MAAEDLQERSFRQLEDVGCPAEIRMMKWSPLMDLIAIITEEGDVWLNRLSWQRVWSVRSSDHKAISLAWRPDGKVLALGLVSCKVRLFNVENSECVHEYELGSRPDYLEWVATKPPATSNLPEDARIFTEKHEEFLPRLPSMPSAGSTVFSDEKSGDEPWDPKRIKDLAGSLSFLVIGDESGVVTLLSHGMLPVAKVNVRSFCGEDFCSRILSASLKVNLQFLSVVVQMSTSPGSANCEVAMVMFDTTLYSSRSHELEVLSLKYGQISSLLTYFDNTFQAMSEAWEDILMEIDSQLEAYAKTLGPETSVPEEFLMLFTCGTASPELQSFLVHRLSEKGLKKLGRAVKSSYSNIQTLAMKNLQSASNALLYHLNDLLGMAKWYERFGVLGLSEAMVSECLNVLGSLMLKTQELFGVIESALCSFEAFFKWLFLVILQFLEAEIPPFAKQFNQQDVSLIAEFLHCQLASGERGKSRFSMERVGQYLEKKPLTFKIDHSGSVWQKILDSCPEMKNVPGIFSACPEKSLATLYDELKSGIHATFQKFAHATDSSLSCNFKMSLFCGSAVDEHVVAQYSTWDGSYHWVAVRSAKSPADSFYVLRVSTSDTTHSVLVDGISVGFRKFCVQGENAQSWAHILDLAFYNDRTLTLLLRCEADEENSEDTLAQVGLSSFEDSWFQPLSSVRGAVCNALEQVRVDGRLAASQRRSLARMKALRVAVSGTRKVSCVLSASRTRVKLFDMDAQDEEADETLDELQASGVSTDSAVEGK